MTSLAALSIMFVITLPILGSPLFLVWETWCLNKSNIMGWEFDEFEKSFMHEYKKLLCNEKYIVLVKNKMHSYD